MPALAATTPAIVEFLATVPLLERRDEAELAELALVLRRKRVREREIPGSQGEHARELVFVVQVATLRQTLRPHARLAASV
jgi:hypothetical protein